MVVSIEELRITAASLRKDGLNSQQIADELSLSQDTISWLLAGNQSDDRPTDVRIGWRTIGVKPNRIAAIGTIMADVADEELGFEEIDTIVNEINGPSWSPSPKKTLNKQSQIDLKNNGSLSELEIIKSNLFSSNVDTFFISPFISPFSISSLYFLFTPFLNFLYSSL